MADKDKEKRLAYRTEIQQVSLWEQPQSTVSVHMLGDFGLQYPVAYAGASS